MALHKPPEDIKYKINRTDFFSGNLFKRVAGGGFVGAVIIGGIAAGGWVWNLAAGVIALGSLYELYKMLSTKYKISQGWGLLGGAMMLLFVSLGFSYAITLTVMSLVGFLVLFTEVVRRQCTGQSYALSNVGGTLSGLAIIILPWSYMIVIRTQTWGHIFLFTIFACTWACDVGAYAIGSKFGSTQFCSRVSPKKSWEGFWAGVAFSTLCGSAMAYFFDFPPLPLLMLGMLCGVAGQLSDLCESALKREAGIKDSGAIIPGHGGFLDRFDSILLNAALAFLIFEVIG